MSPATKESVEEFLSRGGQVGRDLLDVAWGATPLGPTDAWPRSLQTVVRVLLTSRFAMWMAWGPELTFLCNDTYRRDTLGKKYPWALGRPASEVWAEIWPEIGPRIDTVMTSGLATWDEALLLILERSGYPEETYHTFSYSPLADDEGRVAGMLCVVSEETRRVIGQRRMGTLRDLGAVAAGVRQEDAFLAEVARVLGRNQRSLPFTTIHLFDESRGARLACTSGIEPGRAGAAASAVPRAEMLAGRAVTVKLDPAILGPLPTGAWDIPPAQAVALPLPQPGQAVPFGFLVAALNPYCPPDEDYDAFLRLIVQHVATGLAACRTYEAERRRAEELEELDRAKTAFFSNVSHEFRTPLTLMLGPLQDALGQPEGLPGDRVELVHRNALRLLKLVNALLDFSRAEAGRMQAQFRPTDVCRLTSELASTFRAACERAGVELVVRSEDLPEPVYLDRDLWERIVLNLVSNAFKATLAGSICVEVSPVAAGVQLAVSDTGTGIPPEELGRLFQRFHRVRTVTRSYEGSGIGLALVKELTELHGGHVSVSSRLGKGSQFRVWLPFGAAHLPPEHVREEPAEPAASIADLFVEEAMSWVEGSSGDDGADAPRSADVAVDGERPLAGRPRVLIADDNPDLRRYLTSLLSPQFDVQAVSDGEAALEAARARRPDLLVSDVMMPRVGGHELLAALRTAPETRDLPVILLSARAGEESAIEGLAAGADDYLPKPFSGRELLARVRAHVELAHLRRQAAAEVRAERARLELTLRQLPVGVLVAEAPSGRIVLGNEAAGEILGRAVLEAPDLMGASRALRVLGMDGRLLAPEARPLARALHDGEVVEDEDMLFVTPMGRRIHLRASAAPISDDEGRVVAAVLVFQDVSERLRSERLLAAQRDIMTSIAAGEPLARTLETIVECVEQLSEFPARASVLLRSADGRRLEHGAAPSLPAAYNAAIDGLKIGPSMGSCGTAAWRRETVIVSDIQADPLWSDFRELAAAHGLRACWSTPVCADDGELVSTFAVYYDAPREPLAEDRRIVDLLARTAGVAIGRARDAAGRARRLAELQSSIVPRALPLVPGLETAVRFHPADRRLDVGGDFYDVFSLPDGAWGFVIGDVCGHGAGAAAVTALTRHTTRAIARLERSPAQVMATVNSELLHSDHDRFCTALYGRLEPAVGGGFAVTLACGGHPAPLVRRASGTVEAVRGRGPLVGVFEGAAFDEASVELRPGDVIVLYTDGLVERNPRLPGEGALGRLLSELPADDVESLLSALEARALGVPAGRLPDDVAVLVLRATGEAGVAGVEGVAGVAGAADAPLPPGH